jgi:ribosomal protein S18 acetylase RimI-like enzyme
MIGTPTVGGMARERLGRLAERELRAYRAEDESAVLALWARALPRWPVSAEASSARAISAEQLVMVADGGLAGYISVARAQARAQLTVIVVDPACRRAGLGSELLAQARRNLGGVKVWSAGSGAGPYF